MDLQSLEQLEQRISELTERFLMLKDENKSMRSRLSDMNERMGDLNSRLEASQEAKKQIESRVQSILNKLEMLKFQADQ